MRRLGMATRLPSLLDPALLFAHRGQRAPSRALALEAFEHALRLGATGIHVDAWATRDGRLIVSRDGLVRRFPRRRFTTFDAADLPESFVRLEDLYETVGPDTAVSVSTEDADTGREAIRVARAHGAAESLWLNHHDLEVLAFWRDVAPEVRLVNATEVGQLPVSAERRAGELAASRVDAVSLPEPDWSGGLATLFHRFEVFAFVAGAHYERQLARVIDMGVDAVVSDHVERMSAVAATFE